RYRPRACWCGAGPARRVCVRVVFTGTWPDSMPIGCQVGDARTDLCGLLASRQGTAAMAVEVADDFDSQNWEAKSHRRVFLLNPSTPYLRHEPLARCNPTPPNP